jgi:predicted Ser/Thr protein kinase
MSLYLPLQPDDLTRLGRYELLGRLGQGGMGVVFLGQDDAGFVAIKTISSAHVGDARAMRRFRREVEAAKRVPRYCTAQVYEYDFEHDPPFIVSEFIKGPTLEAEVKDAGPLPASRLHGVAIGVAAALTEIHLAGVVHGDLTPRNVLLSLYGPRVIDFGISRVPEQTVSSSSQVLGTPPYMSPEHYQHRPVTTAADVFAWGSVMAFAGTGRPPFGQGVSPQLGYRIVHQPPDLDGLDPIMRRLVEAALQKDPSQRPTASWLQEELKKAARAAPGDQDRTVEVEKVLETARQGSDRKLPPVAAVAPTPLVGMDGFPRRSTGMLLLLASAVLALGVWFHTLGGLGSFANGLVRWLFGYGAYVLPLLVGWWAAALLLDLRTVALWPQGWEALQERTVRSMGRAAWSAIRTITRSPLPGGLVALYLGGLGLLHLSRGAPPVDATRFELDQSGGIFGAGLVGMLNPLLSPRIARLALALLLIAGAAAVAWTMQRRWEMWPAVAVLVACLTISSIPSLYLRDHHYWYWVKLDASNQLAIFRGLAAARAKPVETSSFTKENVPEDLQQQLINGVPAASVQDARRLISALPVAYDQLATAQPIDDSRGKLSPGTCLDHAGAGAVTVPCNQPHGAEVLGVVTSPYRRFPGPASLKEFGNGACKVLFEPYLGIAYDRTTLDFEQLPPSSADWRAGVRTVACLLKPRPAQQVQGPMRGSRLAFADDFSSSDLWAADTDNNPRCQTQYPGDETLSLAKGKPGFFDKKQAGLLCVATTTENSLTPDLVTDAQLSVTATVDPTAPTADRVGFVCREGSRSRYHLTAARDGSWRIEKATDGRLTTLKAGSTGSAVPADPVALRAVCTGGKQGTPVKLALWRNGKLLGRATDSADPLPSGTVGVAIVAADPDPFTATVDDFAVTVPAASRP